MNNNLNSLRENYDKVVSKRLVGKTKGKVWNTFRRNKSI